MPWATLNQNKRTEAPPKEDKTKRIKTCVEMATTRYVLARSGKKSRNNKQKEKTTNKGLGEKRYQLPPRKTK